MISGLFIVEGVDYKVELLKKLKSKAVFLYFTDEGCDHHFWILLADGLLQCIAFWFINVLSSEQKLSI
jgi:hypothetical protein